MRGRWKRTGTEGGNGCQVLGYGCLYIFPYLSYKQIDLYAQMHSKLSSCRKAKLIASAFNMDGEGSANAPLGDGVTQVCSLYELNATNII